MIWTENDDVDDVYDISEDWIRAIQSVAEKLQVLDEADAPDMALTEDEKSMKKRKVVSYHYFILS